LLLDHYFRQRGIRDQVTIKYASPLHMCFSIESVNTVVEPLLLKRGIELETFFNVDEVDLEKKIVYSLEGTEENYDLLIVVPPHATHQYIIDSNISNGAGWVPTDKETLEVIGQENMFALGDVTDIPTSKAGSTAHYQAPIVAANIYAKIVGDKNLKKYDGHVQCFFLTEFGKSLFLNFNYKAPPQATGLSGWIFLRPRRSWYWFKQVFKTFYFSLIAKGKI
jgi:sulfide:quinone oxidoreductase